MTKERLYFICIILIITVFAIALSVQFTQIESEEELVTEKHNLQKPSQNIPTETSRTIETIQNIVTQDDCVVAGCNNQLCISESQDETDCLWHDTYACYDGGICERQPNGECGWRRTTEIMECLVEFIPELSE